MACDYFLKIDGIEGESQNAGHEKEIEISTFRWSERQPGTFQRTSTGGATGGKVQMNSCVVTLATCKASPKLLLACAKGDHIKSAHITCRKAGGGQHEFYKLTFTDLLISHYETGSTDGDGGYRGEAEPVGFHDGAPHDRIEISFAKIEAEYRPQKPDGALDNPVKTGYNLMTNQAV